jgi:hypothetical protein
MTECAPGRTLIFDFKRVDGIDGAVVRLFGLFIREAAALGTETMLAGLTGDATPAFEQLRSEQPFITFDDADRALEYCEQRLLAEHATSASDDCEIPLSEHPLMRGLSAHESAALTASMRRATYSAGEAIVLRGEESDSVFFLATVSRPWARALPLVNWP